MEHHLPCSAAEDNPEADLDPRIQIELEKLNNATDEINKLEIELDEANTTFRMLLNESMRRLKLLSKKLGGCIERARPYYDALEVARHAQLECQRAAVQFQRANEIHQAAKETVALAEQRFLSRQHEWQFDSAWQEMLNHATIKVMDAETQKAESGREHQKRATLFNAAEQQVQQLEQRLRRSIVRSRPYFEEKALCQGQLAMQKERVEALQSSVGSAKLTYAGSLRQLERISEEIHCRRRQGQRAQAQGRREPGVGAEGTPQTEAEGPAPALPAPPLPDYEQELDRCDLRSLGSLSLGTGSALSDREDSEAADEGEDEQELQRLRQRVRELAAEPVEGVGAGVGAATAKWESELNATVARLDHMLVLSEHERERAGSGEAPA